MAINRIVLAIDDDDDLDDINLIFFGIPRRIYNRANNFETLDNWTFFKRFRVPKETALFILSLIEAEIEYPHDLNNSVAPINQVLIFLRLCATGSHQSCVADFAGVTIPTVCRIIKRVTRALASKSLRFIKMTETEQEISIAHHEFYEISRFPRVIGAVDGTHIKIKSPGGDDAEIFRNRKGYFSINVQVVGGANLKILDIVVRWPGSTHDVTIFNNSRIRQKFENNDFPNSTLLGDSGYYLKTYLQTPVVNPRTRAEELYNEAHISSRNVVERLFGGWKMRFPILAYGCRLKLETTLEIIVALAVVYNICKNFNEPPPPAPDDIQQLVEILEADEVPEVPPVLPGNNRGLETRRNLIEQYFAHLLEE